MPTTSTTKLRFYCARASNKTIWDSLTQLYFGFLEQLHLKKLPAPDKLTKVIEVPELARTVVATSPLAAGTLLGVYPGKIIHLREFAEKDEFLKKSLRYAYYLSQDIVIDPTDLFGHVPNKSHLRLALVNEPPLGKHVNLYPISSSKNIWFLVLRDIAVDEQLFTTYGPKFKRNYVSEMAQTNGKVNFSNAEIEILEQAAFRYPWLRRGVSNIAISMAAD